MQNDPKALLFDLGGVVIDIDFQLAFGHWAKLAKVDTKTLAARYEPDHVYERHERGEISSPDYFNHVRTALDISLSDDDMIAGWNGLMIGEIEGITALVDRLKGSIPLYAFSNTNPAHVDHLWDRFSETLSRFDAVFMSPEIGMRKPEKRAFHHVTETIGLEPGDILFFDDMMENVDGARYAGLQAAHTPTHRHLLDALSGTALGQD